MKNLTKSLMLVLTGSFFIAVIAMVLYRHHYVGTHIYTMDPLSTEASPAQAFFDGKLDINKASAEELDALPGIGKVLAERIVEYRKNNGSFRTVRQLLEVKGIGESKLSKIEKLIVIGGSS